DLPRPAHGLRKLRVEHSHGRPDHLEGRRDRHVPGMVRPDLHRRHRLAVARYPRRRPPPFNLIVEVRMIRRSLSGLGFLALAFTAGCASTSSTAAKPIAVPTTPPAPAVNPFTGARFYVDPEFGKMVAKATAPTPEDGARLKTLTAFPTAVWLESLETAKLAGPTLDDALKQEAAGGGPIVPVFVIYNLPNRDCAAEGSRGELFVDKGGEALYQSLFIDLDAAHAGWLGWPKNLPRAVTLFKEVLATAGGADRIRGFAVNVSNYDPPREPKAQKSGPDDPSQDEIGYVEDLAAGLAKVGVTGKGFIIDTSRNGKGGIRSTPGNWCNVKGAGLGERPKVAPAPNIDAYFWVKTP